MADSKPAPASSITEGASNGELVALGFHGVPPVLLRPRGDLDYINVKSFGALGDIHATTGIIYAGSKQITVKDVSPWQDGPFVSPIYRPGVAILGAGSAGGDRKILFTTVTGVNGNTLTLADPAVYDTPDDTPVASDDTFPIRAAIAAALGRSDVSPAPLATITAPMDDLDGLPEVTETIYVSSIAGFTVDQIVRIENEQVKIKAIGATALTVGRGVNYGTMPASHAQGAPISPQLARATAKAPVYFPGGRYPVSHTIRIRSVFGFHIIGDGPDITNIMLSHGAQLAGLSEDETLPGDPPPAALLEIDGSQDGVYEGFTLGTVGNPVFTATPEFARNMLHLRKSAFVAQGTSGNLFVSVHIEGVLTSNDRPWHTGIAVGVDRADWATQCDSSRFINCLVTGNLGDWDFASHPAGNGGTPIVDLRDHPLHDPLADLRAERGGDHVVGDVCPEFRFHVFGWRFGNGNQANNMDHCLYGSSCTGVQYGIFVNGSSVQIFGTAGGGSKIDVAVQNPTGPTFINGFRSEQSWMFFAEWNSGGSAILTLRDCYFHAGRMAYDTYSNIGDWIRKGGPGSLLLDNVKCTPPPFDQGPPPGVSPWITPRVHLTSGPNSCVARGVASNAKLDSTQGVEDTAFLLEPGCQVTVQNYHQLNPEDATIVQVTPLLILRRPGGLEMPGDSRELAAIDDSGLGVPAYVGTHRPTPGKPGRIIFNTTSKKLNIDDGTAWMLPDGTPA